MSLPKISSFILTSHSSLSAERSFFGQGPVRVGAFEVRWLLSLVHITQHSSLIISHEDNLSWKTNQMATTVCVMGFQALCHAANMWALRGMFSWLQTWKLTLPWDLISSPRTKQTCCLVNDVSFCFCRSSCSNTNRILLDQRGLSQTHTQQVKVEACFL